MKPMIMRIDCAAIVSGSSMYSPSEAGAARTGTQRSASMTHAAAVARIDRPTTMGRRALAGAKASTRMPRTAPPRTMRMGARLSQ